MPTPLETLETLASGFTLANVTPSGAAPGHFEVRLLPPGTGRDGPPSIDIDTTTTQLTDAALSANWIAKGVRFQDFAPPSITGGAVTGGSVIGGAPVADPEILALPTTFQSLVDPFTEGDATKPGVPGVLGALAGSFQVPMDVTQTVSVPVRVDVQWHIRDENGNPIADAAWQVGTQTGAGDPPLLTGNDALETLVLTLSAVFVEWTGVDPPAAQRMLAASIRLSADATSTGWIDIPPLTLTVPAVPVPTALILFQDSDFHNNMLLVVPGNSPIADPAADNLKMALETLNSTLGTLGTAAGLASFFVGSLQTVKDAIDGAPRTVFRKTDTINNLNDIDLESGFWNDTEAEDELSSLIMIAAPRRTAECFNARDLDDSEGQMNVVVGPELLVLVNSLHTNNPSSDPAGRVTVPKAPTGSRFLFHDITTFGDELSSLTFGWS